MIEDHVWTYFFDRDNKEEVWTCDLSMWFDGLAVEVVKLWDNKQYFAFSVLLYGNIIDVGDLEAEDLISAKVEALHGVIITFRKTADYLKKWIL